MRRFFTAHFLRKDFGKNIYWKGNGVTKIMRHVFYGAVVASLAYYFMDVYNGGAFASLICPILFGFSLIIIMYGLLTLFGFSALKDNAYSRSSGTAFYADFSSNSSDSDG